MPPDLCGAVKRKEYTFITFDYERMPTSNVIDKIIIPYMKELTGNKYNFNILYTGNTYDDKFIFHIFKNKKVKVTRDEKRIVKYIDGGFLGSEMMIKFCPDISVLTLPFIFNSYDEIRYICNILREDFNSEMLKNGFFMPFIVDQGFEQIYSNIRPVNSLSAFRSLKFGSYQGPIEKMALENIGIQHIKEIQRFEIGSTIRSGEMNAGIGQCLHFGLEFISVIHYYSMTNFRVMPAGAVVYTSVWNSMDPFLRNTIIQNQKIIEDRYCNAIHDAIRKKMESMEKYGLKKVEFRKEELLKVKEITKPVWNNMAGKLYSKFILGKLLNALSEYRLRVAKS